MMLNFAKIGSVNAILMGVHTIPAVLFLLLPHLRLIPYNRAALNAAEHL
jgi:hypothetical protein